MSEQSGFSEKPTDPNRATDNAESRLQAESTERELRPSASGEQRIENKLQALSPDKQVFELSNLNKLNPDQISTLQRSLSIAADQWTKVVEPLRNVFNNMKREEMNGTENANGEGWAKNYMGKVLDVLRENMKDLAAEVPFRVALPVQSFVPGQAGQMKAETLYAFFPPLQTDIQERYVTFPLHAADPAREARLRQNDASMAARISSDEFLFRCKVSSVKGEPLLERRAQLG
ncbi:MAG: hypothetical protein K2X27_03415 [Candidatus Obscuribacterales bacterium]|nr:hypothetical protein [Candidatus Obscuribacterales bacterium]